MGSRNVEVGIFEVRSGNVEVGKRDQGGKLRSWEDKKNLLRKSDPSSSHRAGLCRG